MSSVYDNYTAVIGLEVHMQLHTKSKAFSSDPNEYGSMPNSNVSPISLGHPGTLPRLNENSVNFAIRLGLAINADIAPTMHFARKNYFYADLPKGYQISQDDTPICSNGFVPIKLKDGSEKQVDIERIHMEEDSGKSIHDQDPYNTLVDLNRAGVPLLEMVTKPVLTSSEEAYQYLTEVRKLVRYLDICDGNMEEGSLRCDANVSVMKKGATEWGTRTEVKNMNSIRNVQRAIEHEIHRQIDLLEAGETVELQTRSFNASDGSTFLMRSKEKAHDYRYFPEPDLQPVRISKEKIEAIKITLPPLPNELMARYTKELGLSEYDAGVLTDEKHIAIYFEELISHTSHYKAATNWMMGAVKSYLNERALHISDFPILPKRLAELVTMVVDGKISNSQANQELFPLMLENPNSSAAELAQKHNLLQESDSGALAAIVSEVINENPGEAERFRNGEKQLLGMFMGQVMRKSKGKADPKVASKIIAEMLQN